MTRRSRKIGKIASIAAGLRQVRKPGLGLERSVSLQRDAVAEHGAFSKPWDFCGFQGAHRGEADFRRVPVGEGFVSARF